MSDATPPVTKKFPLAPVQFEQYFEQQTPSTYVLIDGWKIKPHSWSIEENAHGATDTASISLPISTGPDWTTAIYRGDDAGNGDQPVYVKIYASPTGKAETLRFWGVVDIYNGVLSATPEGDIITFACRSFAAPLISTKITTPFAGENSTTVQFIEQQAARFGLNTNILLAGAPLTMKAVLGNEFDTGVHNVGIWELMLKCAVQDDVDIWVDENTLNYATASLIPRITADIKWGRDIKTLPFSHATQFSKNIRVEVRSYTKRIKQSSFVRYQTGPNGNGVITSSGSRTVTSTPIFGTTSSISTSISNTGASQTTVSTASGGGASGAAGVPAAESGKELYKFYVKNKTPAQCADLAKKWWRQISQHEFGITINMPVTEKKLPVISKTSLIRLHGTPFSKLNTTYWPRRITESYGADGWNWSIDAINHEGPSGEV